MVSPAYRFAVEARAAYARYERNGSALAFSVARHAAWLAGERSRGSSAVCPRLLADVPTLHAEWLDGVSAVDISAPGAPRSLYCDERVPNRSAFAMDRLIVAIEATVRMAKFWRSGNVLARDEACHLATIVGRWDQVTGHSLPALFKDCPVLSGRWAYGWIERLFEGMLATAVPVRQQALLAGRDVEDSPAFDDATAWWLLADGYTRVRVLLLTQPGAYRFSLQAGRGATLQSSVVWSESFATAEEMAVAADLELGAFRTLWHRCAGAILGHGDPSSEPPLDPSLPTLRVPHDQR